MKIAIVGSRTFNDYAKLSEILNYFIEESGVCNFNITIISGGARGADSLGELYANNNNICTLIFKADWEKYGKAAGMIRNKDIVNNADVVIAFWDGESKGTKNSIDLAKKLNKQLLIIEPPKSNDIGW